MLITLGNSLATDKPVVLGFLIGESCVNLCVINSINAREVSDTFIAIQKFVVKDTTCPNPFILSALNLDLTLHFTVELN